MASDLGQKLLPELGDPFSSLRVDEGSVEASLVREVALGPYNCRRDGRLEAGPVGDVASGDLGVYTIEDDDVIGAKVVALAEARVFFLACGVPDVEDDSAIVGAEGNGVDLSANGGLVDRLESVLDMALEESGLANATIAEKNDLIRRGSHFYCVAR